MKTEQKPKNKMAYFMSSKISKATQALVPLFHHVVNTLLTEDL